MTSQETKQYDIDAMRDLLTSCSPSVTDDKGAAHEQADSIVTTLLRTLGCGQTADLYEELRKEWYFV